MNDAFSGLLGLALIGALFVAYAAQRRARARKPDASPPPPLEPVVASTDATGASSSPNWGMPIAYCLLLIGADTQRGNVWGYLWQAIFFVVLAVAAYSTLSPRELAKEQARRPGTTRPQHYVTLGVPYLLVPLTAWILVIPVGWRFGAFLPALPWAFLLLVALAGSWRRGP